MKCNHCEAELEEGVTLCPACGCDNTPAEEAAAPVTEEAAPAVETVEEAPTEETSTEETPVEETSTEEASAEETSAEEAQETAAEEKTEKETTPIQEGKLTPGKIALLVVLAVAAVAVVVALIMGGMRGAGGKTPMEETTETTETTAATDVTDVTEVTEGTIPADGNPDDVTCKGTYTVTDEEAVAAKDTVVATLGDAQLTNAELNVYYWMQFYDFLSSYSDYASYMGLDYTLPLDTQVGPDGTGTWQQYLLDASLEAWHTYASLKMEADKAGFEMDAVYAGYMENLASDMETSAASAGFESAQAMLEADMGKAVDMDAYRAYLEEYYTAFLYYDQQVSGIEVSEDSVEAYFEENAATYAESGIEKNDDKYVDVRHILVMPTGGTTADDGTTTYSEEEWEACRASAQAILDEWKAGDATEDSFAALANERSEDGGSNTNGGLYENVYVGQMVEPFEDWCFDESRQYGDTGLVQTTYGYHVMYYVGSTPVWYATAESDLLSKKSEEIMLGAMDLYERSVDYSSIVLGAVELPTTEG